MRRAIIAFAGLLGISANGNEPEVREGIDFSKYIDVLTTRVVHTMGMDFEGPTRGDADLTSASIFALLGVTEFAPNWRWVPAFSYELSSLDVNAYPFGANPAAPQLDNELHRISFQNFIFNTPENSPWVHGAYINAGVASDFSGFDSRDLALSVAIGSGYQFNKNFMLGVGVYGSNLMNDPFIVPGAVFFWTPTEDWLISYYGPRFVARREFGDSIRVGFEGAWNGGWWGTEAFRSNSRLEVNSFRTGLYYRHKVAGELWLEIAAGYTFGNEVKIYSPGGRDLFPAAFGEAEGAPYVSLGLSLSRW